MSDESSHGTLVKLDISGTYTTIPGVGDIDFNPGEWGETDVTDQDSNGHEEIIKGIRRGMALSFPINWDPANAVHTALQTAFDATGSSNFQVVYPDAGNKTFQFTGFVMGLSAPAPVEGKMMRDVSIRISGALEEDPS